MTPADLMEILERIESHLVWQTEAFKHLLAAEAGIELEGPDELTDWLAEDTLEHYPHGVGHHVDPGDGAYDDPNEHIAVRTRPQPKRPPCPHNQQVLVSGNVQCARCGTVLTSSGVDKTTMVSQTGAVERIPGARPPQWATERSRGASSKNPGGPLVPHSD
jgi:hypothetical protein